jgi:hypothetical protein
MIQNPASDLAYKCMRIPKMALGGSENLNYLIISTSQGKGKW